jgi:outer membrane biosynthesis protein TonB
VLFIVDGKEYKGEINKIDQNSIAEMNVLKDETATKKYGEKGKNGVLEITLKNGNENTKITSQLEFRKFIAEKIKYPVEAVETNTHGNISFFFRIDDNGKIFDIKRPNKGDISLEEIVVVSSKTEIPGRYIKNADNKILTNEIERVLESTPLIEIPEFKGKTIKINVKFELQETTDKQTILELRSAIAQNIKYPVLAQENNQQGVVEIWAYIQKDGTISRITDKKPDGKFINVDEVVVTALKSEKAVTSEKSKELDLLIKESKRVIEQLSPLNIPELAGETVSFRIRFVLQ